jgi:CRP-like cAMP-binding protein
MMASQHRLRVSPVPLEADGPRFNSSNRLLRSLPREHCARLLRDGEAVELHLGDVLHEADTPIEYAYFPDTSFISITATAGDRSMEVGLIGNEGMLGVPLVLGLQSSRLRALVQGAGRALRVKARTFQRELAANALLQEHIDRYLYVRFVDLAQSALCNRYHVVEARLARLLLMAHDRSQADCFHMTHKLIAGMLGVRRSGVTTAAGILQRRKVISYSRGMITVLDRAGLEQEACICYQIARSTYEQLLGPQSRAVRLLEQPGVRTPPSTAAASRGELR